MTRPSWSTKRWLPPPLPQPRLPLRPNRNPPTRTGRRKSGAGFSNQRRLSFQTTTQDRGDYPMRHKMMTTGKMWLAAGLATVLAGCAAMDGASSAQAAWPTKSSVVATQSGFTAEGLAALDARLKQAVDKQEVAGLEYALVKDGKVVAFNIYGNQSYGGPPMAEDTLFRIRSMTKPVTGVAMMQLWEQGKWKPEDPVTKFLPEFANLKVATSSENLDNLVAAKRAPNMNEVMTHTAGFGYGLSANNAVDRAFIADHPMDKKDLPALVKRTS
ncbi:MAG: hypothetical protein EON57_04255, partial [Alphaproteobacteria bacterium]